MAMLLVLLLHGLVDDPLYARRIALLLFLAPMGLIVAACRLSGVGSQPAPAATNEPPSATLVLPSPFANFALRDVRRLRVFVFLTIALIVAVAFANRTPLAAAWHANLGALAQTRAELAVYDPETLRQPDDRRRAAAGGHVRRRGTLPRRAGPGARSAHRTHSASRCSPARAATMRPRCFCWSRWPRPVRMTG